MQLILSSETDIGIKRKMSVIEQETFDKTFKTNTTQDLKNEYPNIIKEQTVLDCIEKEDIVIKNFTIDTDDKKILEENKLGSNIDQDSIEIISKENDLISQCGNSQTSNKESEHMKIEQTEDVENIEEKCDDEEMTSIHTEEISCKQLTLENIVSAEKTDVVISENITDKPSDVLQEITGIKSTPLEINSECLKLNLVMETDSDDVKLDTDLKPDFEKIPESIDLKQDSDDVKQESDDLKQDPDNLKTYLNDMDTESSKLKLDSSELKDSDDLKPNSEDSNTLNSESDDLKSNLIDQESVSSELKLDSNDPKSDSNDLKSNSNDLKSDSNDLNLISNDLKSDSNDLKSDLNDLKSVSNDPNSETNDLKSDSNDLKADSDDLKSDSNDLRSVSNDLESDSNDIKSDSNDLKSDSNGLKSNSNDLKSESDNLKLDSSQFKPDPSHPKQDCEMQNLDSNSEDLIPDFGDTKEHLQHNLEGDIISIQGSSSDDKINITDGNEECKTKDSDKDNEKSNTSIDMESKNTNKSADSEIVKENNEIRSNLVDDSNNQSIGNNISNNKEIPAVSQEIQNIEKLDKDTEKEVNEPNSKDPKKLPLICRLSNTLDILSDEEDEPSKIKEDSQTEKSTEKQCIQIEDDDDIMLVDEETTTKANVEISGEIIGDEMKQTNDELSEGSPKEKEVSDQIKEDTKITETDLVEESHVEKPADVPQTPKSLLPVTFLKTCKKNLKDMTKDELEEFCILKIVESVVDRSNLSEIKTQLKIMAQNIEEYKKKALLLTKQNRDLQVVLKSVQEEQKKKSDLPITPLKITRSVGMQVFMTDKTVARRKSTLGPNNIPNIVTGTSSATKQNKLTAPSIKTLKNQLNATNQQIPVPRLVPANNNINLNKVQSPTANVATKTPVTPPTPNGVRNSPPVQKATKRPLGKMGHSVMVDLTDDEPPAKVVQLNINPPVRLVPPQSLLAPQRQPFGSPMNSPRKVYIPISGSQNQVRPGQTIMLKPIVPQGPRQRGPAILPKQNQNSMRMTRIASRHPAPLPDCMKQYQPPNWKSLPPAPELKLSKVENGIVISWKIDGYQEDNHEEIASYQLYAYQETSSPPSTALWKKIGDVKALPLPMACTLTQFMAGYKYYFAVRAVDIRSRLGPFSAPGSILLLNKM